MDYKYIQQILERYWEGRTSLEEENILRTFFSQIDVPEELKQYRSLFLYEQTETKTDVLGSDFDDRLLAIIGEEATVKAHRVTLKERLTPLFKAAAIVAVILTLGNAAQFSFNTNAADTTGGYAASEKTLHGASVAYVDSAMIDTLQKSAIDATQPRSTAVILK